MMLVYSSANRFWLSAVTMPFNVAAAIGELNSEPVSPPICTAPPLPTWYWNTVSPAQNTALPETKMLVKVALALALATRSTEMPAPTDLHTLRAQGLPGRLLVIVRAEGAGPRHAVGGPLRLRHRCDQRPLVGQDGESAGAEQVRDLGHAGMDRKK